MKGFTNYNIDYVIKFGGSLLEEKDILPKLIESICSSSKRGLRIVIIPGGGPTDNTIERLDKWGKFHMNTHHHACALAQDQTGIMLSDVGYGHGLRKCDNLESLMEILDAGNIPVLLPSKIIFTVNPFEKTWDISSDSMAAWFSWLLDCDKTIVLTNIDGIYPSDKIGESEHLISEISADELIQMGHTAVDQCFAPFVKKHNVSAWVINGLHPNRINMFLNNQEVVATKINPK